MTQFHQEVTRNLDNISLKQFGILEFQWRKAPPHSSWIQAVQHHCSYAFTVESCLSASVHIFAVLVLCEYINSDL